MQSTKYYTISEVAKLFGVPQTSLRYLEKIIPKFRVRKIRGRRYYSQENIEILRKNISSQKTLIPPPAKQYSLSLNNEESIPKRESIPESYTMNILQKIASLENKFLSLKARLL